MGAEITRIADGQITGGGMKRKLVAAVALTAVVLVQLTIVNGLALPGGGTPDLVLLCVIALGITGGPVAGLIAGFCAGLALDLAPPTSQLVGQYALVLCLVGYGAGRLRFTLQHSARLALAAATAMAVLGEAMAAGLALMVDTPDVSWATVARVLPPSVLLDIVLSPVTLFVWVRLAVALGTTISPSDDSPVFETGGSAAPVSVAALAGAAGTGGVDGVRIGTRTGGVQRGGQRRAVGGDSLAAATGRWLLGDVAEAAPAIGAIGWLDRPARSRRARREQARLTALLTGARPRKGAFWVGRRPPGLLPTAPLAPPSASGLGRLRPGGGVAGSAVAVQRQAQTGHGRPGRTIHLGLADKRRERTWSANRRAQVTGLAAAPNGVGGRNRFPVNGVLGPDVPRIAFGTGGLPGAGRAARPVPRIAFGTGGLPGAGRAGRPVPRIAFGTGGLPGARRGLARGAAPEFRRPARNISGHKSSRSRQPKTARIRARHRAFRRLSWMRKAGGRTTVWRIGAGE